ncbi:MAG: hypothetical protein VZR54_07130 [Ruminococcus sp.]|nr:hypothetical protein [Ruminococcus sp.]
MGNEITFTPSEMVAVILAICASVVTISGAIGVIAKWFSKAKAPEVRQNLRLDAIDKKLEDFEKTIATFRQYFANDDNRFKAIEKSNKVTQNAILALLKHSLNGNDVDALKEAEKALESYLIEK